MLNHLTVQLLEIENYAKKILLDDQTGHSVDHMRRVVKNSKTIHDVEGGDLFFILAGAYLHDVLDDKVVSDVAQEKVALTHFLKSLPRSDDDVTRLFEIIEHVSFSQQLERKADVVLSKEAKIVQDADRLDALGAIGIGRTFYYGGSKGHEMYNPLYAPRETMTKKEYRMNQSVIHHFYEKLFKLPQMMHTNTAKTLAKRKVQLMEDFVAAFLEDWA